MKKDKGKYRITRKNEGTWIKCSVVNENNIVKFVGLYKDAKEWIKKQSKGKKKSIIGWMYDEEDLEFHSISAWNDSPLGLYLCILKHKKDLGKFSGKKIKITIQEL